MNTSLLRSLGVCLAIALAPHAAWASGTCSFDLGTRVVTVTVNGTATISVAGGGDIQVGAALCGGATTSTADAIQVNGSALADKVTLTGHFAPGFTAETDAASEIEIAFALGAGNDTVTINETAADDLVLFTSAGVDVGTDGDQDLNTSGVEILKVMLGAGADEADATAYAAGGKLYLYGDAGADALHGSPGNDWLYGGADDDYLDGGDGNDILTDGPGRDVIWGGAGNDKLKQDAAADLTGGDSDEFHGGPGRDTLDYSARTERVYVSLNESADDGSWQDPNYELDNAFADIENVTGGAGNDWMYGTASINTFIGGPGDDTLIGDAGNDVLEGGDGNDHIWGGYGNDKIYGDAGNDELVGEQGGDKLWGGDGADTMTGGAGTDEFHGEGGNDLIYNNDGVAETVDCGDGIDDPEASAGDSFLACENI